MSQSPFFLSTSLFLSVQSNSYPCFPSSRSKRGRHSFSPSPSISSGSYSDSFDSYTCSSSSFSRSPSRSPHYHRSLSRSPSPYLRVKSGRHSHKSRRAATPPRHRRHLPDRCLDTSNVIMLSFAIETDQCIIYLLF